MQPALDHMKALLALGDDENLMVLIALFVPFLIDVSLLTAALPLASLLYSLLAQVGFKA